MFDNKHILAVVPARQGSKGIPDKNMRKLKSLSLIGWAGKCLGELPWIDAKIISTDSPKYAREGEKYGLRAPFLRPEEISGDSAGAVETVTHALFEAEKEYQVHFHFILIVEPTSPLRMPSDIYNSVELLNSSGVDSVVTVNLLTSKFHPAKVLAINENMLWFYEERGSNIVARQSLENLFWRNGICYALTRECLLEKKAIFTDFSLPLIIDREIVNIDEPIELEWAEFLLDNYYRDSWLTKFQKN